MKISLKKYGLVLMSRPAGKEAIQQFLKGPKPKKASKKIELDFKDLVSVGPSWLDEFVQGLKNRGYKVIYGSSKNPSVTQSIRIIEEPSPIHPWRLCPAGQHWVRTPPVRVSSGEKKTDFTMTTRHGHCAHNPSGKDQLFPDEILEISDQYFSSINEKPCPLNLGFGDLGSKYDALIAGWVKYWNDIFQPADPLDVNLVKALIASESRFRSGLLANKKNQNSARGLMQITNKTRKILADEKGELKDHFFTLTREQLNDPSVNICAGIRWLFQKRKLASSKIGREATWEETVYHYKGCDTVKPSRAKELMDRFSEKLRELQKCGRK